MLPSMEHLVGASCVSRLMALGPEAQKVKELAQGARRAVAGRGFAGCGACARALALGVASMLARELFLQVAWCVEASMSGSRQREHSRQRAGLEQPSVDPGARQHVGESYSMSVAEGLGCVPRKSNEGRKWGPLGL